MAGEKQVIYCKLALVGASLLTVLSMLNVRFTFFRHMSDTETYRNYVANFEKWEKEVEKRRAQLKQQKQRAVAQQKASTLGALAKQAHKRIKLNETSSSHQSNTEPPPDSIVYGKLPEPKPRSTIESHQPPPVSLLRFQLMIHFCFVRCLVIYL